MRKLAIVTLMMALVVSCKKEADSGTSLASVESAGAPGMKGLAADRASSVQEASAGGAAPRVTAPLPATHMVIRTGNIALVASDVGTAIAAVTHATQSEGGYVNDSKQWRERDQLRATLTVRVPAAHFDSALAAFRRDAVRVQSETTTGEDVSQEFTDLGGRLRNAEAAEIELRELLTTVRQRTQKAADILEIYDKLTEVRGQIEQIKGRMQYLSQMTSMSTITIELIPDALAEPLVTPGWRPLTVMREATRTLVISLRWIVDVAIWVVIYLVPLALLFGLIGFILRAVYRWFIQRLRRTPAA